MAKRVIMPALGMAQETGLVVTWLKKEGDTKAHATITLERKIITDLMMRRFTIEEAIAEKRIQVSGEEAKLVDMFELMDDFNFMFPTLEPRS